MCQSKQPEVPAARAPKSPWRRLFRQSARPKLSRKVVSGARVNLNLYWKKFEEVTALNRPSNVLICTAPLEPATTSADDNAINDNLANEMTESGNKTSIANL